MQFMAPVIQLVNLTAETTYFYSISDTDTAIDTTVVGSCDGTFTTRGEATPSPTMPGKVCNHAVQLTYQLHCMHDSSMVA